MQCLGSSGGWWVTYFADPSKVCAGGCCQWNELGEVNKAIGDLMLHDNSLEFGSFQADLFELEDNWPEAFEHPQDVVPSPSEAIVLPSSSAQHVELQSCLRSTC